MRLLYLLSLSQALEGLPSALPLAVCTFLTNSPLSLSLFVGSSHRVCRGRGEMEESEPEEELGVVLVHVLALV